jgi:small subunit ribosomal protein S1
MDPAEVHAMMEAFAPAKSTGPLRQGQRVRGTISRLTPTLAFVAIGGKGDASIDRVELDPSVELGSAIEAYVLSTKDGEIRLTRSLGGDATRELLDEAVTNRIPVQGKVVSRNEHGFEVQISGGVRGFCPLSQIDHVPEADLDAYIGRSLSFRVLDVRGKEAVVSHRAIAQVEAREEADRALANIREGEVYDGVVTGLREFGAFVRIAAGLEGLVHLSNLGKNRVNHPSEVVTEGQEVRVRVLSVDIERKRLNLGIRQADDSGPASAAPTAPGRRAEPMTTGGSFGTLGALLQGVQVAKKPAAKKR